MSLSRREILVMALVVACLLLNSNHADARRCCFRQFRRVPIVACQPNTVAAKTVLLSVVPLKQRVDRLIVRIDVTNCTDEAIVWDSDFSTYLNWDLKSEDGTSIPASSVANVDRTESIIRKTRFVTIQSGRSFSKMIDLTGGFRHLIHGHGSAILPNGAMHHIPTGYEEQIKFNIPPTARRVLISAQYSGGGDFGGFAVWFGYSPTEIDLWTGRVASSQIRIPLLNAQHK